MQIGTNQSAQTAVRALYTANAAVAKASERISTGFRINRASDDPAGLGIANKLKTYVGSFSKVLDNLSQGTGLVQVVDGTLSQIVDTLSYMRVAAVASEGTLTTANRAMYQTQIDEYLKALDSASSNALWNGESVMYNISDDTLSNGISIQSGINSSDSTTLTLKQITASDLGLTSLSVSSESVATTSLGLIDAAIDTVSIYQSYVGAMENIMDIQSNVATNNITTYSSAYGNIMNADLAQETANLAAAQIQQDAATAMLAQSNTMNKDLVAYLLKSTTS